MDLFAGNSEFFDKRNGNEGDTYLPVYFVWNDDYQTYLQINRHSWNSYKGVHFDIMCPFLKLDDDVKWIYYFNTDYRSNYKNWKIKKLASIDNYINHIGITGDKSTRNINTMTKSQRFIKTNFKQARGYLNG